MLPSLVARDLEKGLKSFVRNEFPIASNGFKSEDGRSILDVFLDKPESLIKGPWVEVKLPFRQADFGFVLPFEKLNETAVLKDFHPYRHQLQAFDRLRWTNPQSTVVATGTGSGKTECFLYPILEYCLNLREPGIKAILIYPMNALASDQAKRIAELCANINVGLKKMKLRAGLYTGDSATQTAEMTPTQVINDRGELRRNPPDILITNYKMLDFLLMRPDDQTLWAQTPIGMTKYLVVDELHTFDGAQGTDLACLIRRLKDKLHAQESLACIGTSATIGGTDSIEQLRAYAETIFDTNFSGDAIVVEDRLNDVDFLASFGRWTQLGTWPVHADLRAEGTIADYLTKVENAWFQDLAYFDKDSANREVCLSLSQKLPHLEAFRRFIHEAQGVCNVNELAVHWAKTIAVIHDAKSTLEERVELARNLIDSLVAMISMARLPLQDDKLRPFLQVRTQLWARELARTVVTVEKHPVLAPASDFANIVDPLAMPLVGCRECNEVAWGGVVKGNDSQVQPDLQLFYSNWFTGHQDSRLFYRILTREDFEKHRKEVCLLCPHCRTRTSLMAKSFDEALTMFCPQCDCENAVLVWVPKMVETQTKNDHKHTKFVNKCPCCQSRGSLRIFGAANASLSSAVVAYLNGSTFNNDHKIIAFSDSVQDAAQRAGFIEARNYNAVTRHAIVSFLNEKLSTYSNNAMSFDSFLRSMPQRWLQKKIDAHNHDNDLGLAAFLSTFIAPDMQWRRDWHEYERAVYARDLNISPDDIAKEVQSRIKQSKHQWEELANNVLARLGWEALVEFGYRAGVGRTVEITGAAVISPDMDILRSAAHKMANRLSGQIEAFKGVSQEKFFLFILGVVNHMRREGAFNSDNLGKMGEDYSNFLKTGNAYRAFTFSRILPSYGKFYPPPMPLTLAELKKDQFHSCVLARKNQPKSWYQEWTEKLFSTEDAFVGDELQIVFETLFRTLKEEKFLKDINRDQIGTLWTMDPGKWIVTNRTATMLCKQCGRRHTVAAKDVKHWINEPCFVINCTGVFVQDDNPRNSAIYNMEPERVNAQEHTGLVDGEKRAEIELSFGYGTGEWNVNLLSATPTLEMGIDIGNLSAVLQCSMPPTQANYVQRIGRAGRKDGNAVAFTLANRDRHGQYFWLEPEEMIKGEITTPGVFLGAVSVLERQLIAYTFDRWVSSKEVPPKLPGKLKDVLDAVAENTSADFPNTYMIYVNAHRDEILSDFEKLFECNGKSTLSDDARNYLRKFFFGDQGDSKQRCLEDRINDLLQRAVDERESHMRRIKELTKRIRELKKKPSDEATENEINECDSQLSMLDELVKEEFNQKFLFNFFTDKGLLPNYAFPEEGVTVESVIIKRFEPRELTSKASNKDASNNQGSYKPYRFSFDRSAGRALYELAPNSVFYAGQHKLHIDQINLGTTTLETWQFCPACSYSEKVASKSHTQNACPYCGNEGWADVGQKRQLIRMHQLFAHADARNDRIRDDDEYRNITLQSRQTLIYADKNDVAYSWQLKDHSLSFGFEFLKKATIRDINFGSGSETAGAKMSVAGAEGVRSGFKICNCCGKVFKENLRKGEKQHDFGCKWRNVDDEDSHWINGLFLYREFNSEAIRIRVPVCDGLDFEGAARGTASLIAALRLGLRRYFNGNVDHLNIDIQTEPSALDPDSRDRYIVIYDSVPGGTGYLKDLASSTQGRPEFMVKLLKTAWLAVSNCDCVNQSDKDGCYHCVYQYRDSSQRNLISRKIAQDMLDRIARHSASDYDMLTSKSVVDFDPLDFSALERLFCQRIQRQPKFRLTPRLIKGSHSSWTLTVPISEAARARLKEQTKHEVDETYTWIMQSQVDMGIKQGNKQYPSCPDFVFYPARERDVSPELTCYVFADGWRYHADSLVEDTQKRQSLLNLGYRVWVLTWEDLTERNNQESDNYGEKRSSPDECFVTINDSQMKDKGFAFLKKAFGKDVSNEFLKDTRDLLNKNNSFNWLVKWLSDPIGFKEQSKLLVDMVFFPDLNAIKKIDAPIPYALDVDLNSYVNVQYARRTGVDSLPFDVTFAIATEKKNPPFIVDMLIRINDKKYSIKDIREDKTLHEGWRAFWKTFNLGQFAHRFWASALSNEKAVCYEHRIQTEKDDYGEEASFEAEWSDFGEACAIDAELIRMAIAEKLPIANRGGYDLIDESGIVLGTYELGWECNEKWIVVVDEEAQCLKEWKTSAICFSCHDKDWPKAVLAAMKN